jgi:hypothetical protein
MNDIITPVAHKTLRAAQIAPGKSPAFSPNLYAYLKAHGHFYRDGGIAEGVYAVRAGTKAAEEFGAGTLMLGFPDDAFFSGTRLISALCNGAKDVRMSYVIGNSVDPIPDFWDRYLLIGRCAIDPGHQEHFMSDRFDVRADGRTCRWCGHQQHKVVTPRVVYDEAWVSK